MNMPEGYVEMSLAEAKALPKAEYNIIWRPDEREVAWVRKDS